MKKRIIITAMALITLLASLNCSAPLANSADLDCAIDTAELFLRQCADNMYQYHGNDISKMTTASFSTSKLANVSAEAKKSVSMTKNYSDNSSITVEEFPYFIDQKVKYYKKFRSERNIERDKFNVRYYVKNSHINGNYAVVEIIEDISFYYAGKNTQSSIQTDYNVLLYKEDKNWLVCNIISDDDFDRYYKSENLSFEKLNSKAEKETLRLKSEENKKINSAEEPKGLADVINEKIENGTRKSASEKGIIVENPTGIEYDENNAASYALTYSKSTTHNDVRDGYYNENFPNFHNSDGDCQNFVSQCIWAGFNGNNDPKAINGLYRPMDSDYPYWYCSGNGTTRSPSWAGTKTFDEYTNDTSNGARIDTIKIGDYNSKIDISSLQIGDEVLVNNGGHAIIIVDVDENDAYYCAHSSNTRRLKLSDGGFYKGKIIRPVKYVYSKWYPDGGNHTFSSVYVLDGVDATCNSSGCSHNRMQVNGFYMEPIPENLSFPVYLDCNLSPYRVAIGIKAPNGTTTWHEALNVTQTQTDYTFTEPGEYLITLSARDKNPDKYSDSTSTTVKYTVRVLNETEAGEYWGAQ